MLRKKTAVSCCMFTLVWLQPYERANLVDALIPMSFQDDEQIVKQGDEADGMYFIVSGGVRVLYHNEDNKQVLVSI